MFFRHRPIRVFAAPAALLTLALLLHPGQARAANPDCPALFELYRACLGQGIQASNKACMEASAEAMNRTLSKTAHKNAQTARALVELVCSTACDDSLAQTPPATRLEFTEAFCD